jgi:hypothetical protein
VPGAGLKEAPEDELRIHLLDGLTGAPLDEIKVPPLRPYFQSTYVWQGLSLSADGRELALATGDGRVMAWALDEHGKATPRWTHPLATPREFQGARMHCTLGWALHAGDTLLVQSDRAWEEGGMGQGLARPLKLHPEACTIHAFDAPASEPRRLWHFEAPFRPQGLWLSPTQRWLAFACEDQPGLDPQGQPKPPNYSVIMLDLSREGTDGAAKLVYEWAADGPIFFNAAWSRDARYLAVVEGPRPAFGGESATRTYRVVILH